MFESLLGGGSKQKKRKTLDEKKTFYDYRYLLIIMFFILLFIGMLASSINPKLMSMFVLLGMFTCILPYFALEYFEFAKYKKMEEYFPFFLRDFAEAIRSGMTFPSALRMTAKIDYGALSVEIRRAAAQLSWGIPFVKVLRRFGERLKGSKVLKQSIAIIIETFNSGGDVATTMDSLADSMSTIREMELERKAALQQQVMIIYIVFIIFLGLLVGIDKFLITRFMSTFQTIEQASEATQSMGFGGFQFRAEDYCDYAIASPVCGFGRMFGFSGDDLYYKSIFLLMALIQSVCQGILIGVMLENSAKAGFKHVAIMMALSLVALPIFLG